MINEVFIFNGRQQLGRTELKLVAAELRAGDVRRRSNNAHTIYSLTVCTTEYIAAAAAAAECNVELARAERGLFAPPLA